MYALSFNVGTLVLTFKSHAKYTSLSKPRSTSSFPEVHFIISSVKLPAEFLKTANAALLSGDKLPDRYDIIAPAPTRSSNAGLKVLSGHCSPAGITAILHPAFMA